MRMISDMLEFSICRTSVLSIKVIFNAWEQLPQFYNPFSSNYQSNNYLTNSSLLMLMAFNSTFKQISLIHAETYKYRINKLIQRKIETFEEKYFDNVKYNIGGQI